MSTWHCLSDQLATQGTVPPLGKMIPNGTFDVAETVDWFTLSKSAGKYTSCRNEHRYMYLAFLYDVLTYHVGKVYSMLKQDTIKYIQILVPLTSECLGCQMREITKKKLIPHRKVEIKKIKKSNGANQSHFSQDIQISVLSSSRTR